MSLIYLILTSILLLVLVFGLATFALRSAKSLTLSVLFSSSSVVLVLFFIEHFVGLGPNLSAFWPFLVTLCGWQIYQHRDALWDARDELGAFAIPFVLVLGARLIESKLDGHVERLTDLYFVNQFRQGVKLPAPDLWLHGQVFDFYYALQHYAAALIGRLFHFGPGKTYHFAFVLIYAYMGMAAWFVAKQWLHQMWERALITAAVLGGGTGLSPLVNFLIQGAKPDDKWKVGIDDTRIWLSNQFMGIMQKRIDTEWGQKVLSAAPDAVGLPMETIGFHITLNEYHPPLGGFLLMMMLAGCMFFLAKEQRNKIASALLGLSFPLIFMINAWVAPLQAVFVGAWAYRNRQLPDWRWALGALGTGFILCYPFISYFAAASTPLGGGLIPREQATPLREMLFQLWPMFGLMILVIVGYWQKNKELLLFPLVLISLFIFAELFYINNAGHASRYNATLKWWSWIYTAAVAILGTLTLASAYTWVRYTGAAILLAICFQIVTIGSYYLHADPDKIYRNKLHGHAWLSAHHAQKDLLEYLRIAPKGLVLEKVKGFSAYSHTSAFALLADKPSLVGWPGHQSLWRAHPPSLKILVDSIDKFYKGELENPAPWMLEHEVRYILWGVHSDDTPIDVFHRVNAQLQGDYYWKEVQDQPRIGMWIRRD